MIEFLKRNVYLLFLLAFSTVFAGAKYSSNISIWDAKEECYTTGKGECLAILDLRGNIVPVCVFHPRGYGKPLCNPPSED